MFNMHFVIHKKTAQMLDKCFDNSVKKGRESFLQIYWRENINSKPGHYFTSQYKLHRCK